MLQVRTNQEINGNPVDVGYHEFTFSGRCGFFLAQQRHMTHMPQYIANQDKCYMNDTSNHVYKYSKKRQARIGCICQKEK